MREAVIQYQYPKLENVLIPQCCLLVPVPSLRSVKPIAAPREEGARPNTQWAAVTTCLGKARVKDQSCTVTKIGKYRQM